MKHPEFVDEVKPLLGVDVGILHHGTVDVMTYGVVGGFLLEPYGLFWM